VIGERLLRVGHDWVCDSQRLELPSGYAEQNYQPIICPDCGTRVWRGRGDGRIYIVDSHIHDSVRLRGLTDDEKSCEYMIIKHVMET